MKFSDPYRKHTRGNWWWNKGQPPRQATLALKKGDTSMNKMFAALGDHPLVVDIAENIQINVFFEQFR